MNSFLSLFTIYLVLFATLVSADDYRSPQPQLLKIDITKVSINTDERTSLAEKVAHTCSYFDERNDSSRDYCHKALSLSLLLDEKNKTAIVSDSLLSRGAELVTKQENRTPLFKEIQTTIKKLSNKSTSEDIKLIGFLYSLCITLDGQNTDLIYEYALFEKEHGKVSWVNSDSHPPAQVKTNGKFNISKERLSKSQIKSLLVIRLSNGKYAGTVAQMNTIARANKKHRWLSIGFNQKVGKLMISSRAEVAKYLHQQYHTEKALIHLEFSFADKYSLKDGPSAALAMALMSNSILTGKELDQGIAVTGDMIAVGEVQPVGATASKVKAAIKSNCTHIAIPAGNERAIEDHCLIHGISMLYQIQIFGLDNIEQAESISYEQKKEKVTETMKEFQSVMTILKNNPNYVYNDKVKEKLNTIITTIPYHLSAKLLLKHANKQAPKTLSANRSFAEVQRIHFSLLRNIKKDTSEQNS